MGDRIDFPHNNQVYFEKATNHIAEQEFEQALHYLEKIYETEQETNVNHLYTLVLYRLGRAEEALEIAQDKKEYYMQEESRAVFYTSLLIKNHLFLEAEVLIQNYLSDPTSPHYMEWKNVDQELMSERESVQRQVEIQRKETIKDLQQLTSYSALEQTEIVQKARILTLQELQEAASVLLIRPDLPPITQKAFLELLIEKEDPNEYTFHWLDGPRKIVPKQLKSFDQLSILKQVLNLLEQKLEKNPSYIEAIYTEILSDLLLLYPFVEEVITDADYWVDRYLGAFDLSTSWEETEEHLTSQEEDMNKWLDYLNQIAQRNPEGS